MPWFVIEWVLFKTVLKMPVFGLWRDCRPGHSGGQAIGESGLLSKQFNEEVHYEKIWARIIGFHVCYIFGWLRIDVWPEESGG